MNDNSTTIASPTTISSYILSKDLYDQYAAAWKDFAGQPGVTNLTDAFHTSGKTRLVALSFPLERIQKLVSAVGVHQISARFLLMPGDARDQFNLALFATDATGYRLSAYYLPDLYYTPIPSELNRNIDIPIPQDLASIWQGYWHDEPKITADMFTTYIATTHEPTVLEGYNFKIKDFVSILFGAGPNISLGLGLHEYHSPEATSDADLTKTFGLVLQNPAGGQAARGAGAASMDFDMAFPCPPNT